MADNSRARSYLGLAKKAGKVRSGEFQTEEAVKKKLACLVILAADASDNTKKKFQNIDLKLRKSLLKTKSTA